MKNFLSKIDIVMLYYPLVMLLYALTLLSRGVRPGVGAALLLFVIFALMIKRLYEKRGNIRAAVNTIDILAAIYFIYNLLSGIWCTGYGMPVSVWAGDFSTGIATMVFYLAARLSGEEEQDRFYKGFVISVCLIGLLGLLLYIWAPQFYLDYLFDYSYISKADVSTMRIRMISVIGSILMGFLSVTAMLAASRFILKSRGKKGKLLFFAALLFAFLSNQRSAMVLALLVLLYVNYLIFFTYGILPKKYFFAECGIMAALFAGLAIVYFRAIMKVYYRLVSLPGAIGQRSDQWIGAINNMNSLWLGNGLGANGHRAALITEHLIADGGLAKLFVEMGVIGTSVFVYMMILCFKYGKKDFFSYAPELGIIAAALLSSIGSNTLQFQLATPVFFYAIGVVARGVRGRGSKETEQ